MQRGNRARVRSRTGAAVLVVLGLALTACFPRFGAGDSLQVTVDGDAHVLSWPEAVDIDPGQRIVSYQVDVDGDQVALLPATTRRCRLTGLPVGSYEVSVTAYDDAGEWSGNRADGRIVVPVSVTTTTTGPPTCTMSGAPTRVSDAGAVVDLIGDGQFMVVQSYDPAQIQEELIDLDAGTRSVLSAPPASFTKTRLSDDHRYRAFHTGESLEPTDTNGVADIYIRDYVTGGLERITDGPRDSVTPIISGDGDHVLYTSFIDDEFPQAGFGEEEVVVWSRATGESIRITDTPDSSYPADISDDGRYVIYDSRSLEPLPNGPWGIDLFRWDRVTGISTPIASGNGASRWGSISSDGARVAFWSAASDLVPGDENGFWDVFIWDGATDTIERITDSNTQYTNLVEISGDGRSVVFLSTSTNLVTPDTNFKADAFVWDEGFGISVVERGTQDVRTVSINEDGSRIAITSFDALEPTDTNGKIDAYVWDRG